MLKITIVNLAIESEKWWQDTLKTNYPQRSCTIKGTFPSLCPSLPFQLTEQQEWTSFYEVTCLLYHFKLSFAKYLFP